MSGHSVALGDGVSVVRVLQKTRRNRSRDPALHNPRVFLSATTLGQQNHLRRSRKYAELES